MGNLEVGIGTGATIRTAWTGGLLGGSYLAANSQAQVKSHSYRLGLLIGAQPLKVGELLNGTERGAGTPQRFLWMVANTDPDLTRATLPPDPGGLDYVPWQHPEGAWKLEGSRVLQLAGEEHWAIGVPDEVRWEVQDVHLARAQGVHVGLGAHDNLNRLKVALGLALLDRAHPEGPAIDATDWRLAGIFMETSTAVRDWLEAQAADQGIEAEADRQLTKSEGELVSTQQVARLARRLLAYIEEAQAGLTRGDLARKVGGRDRLAYNQALRYMATKGWAYLDIEDNRWKAGRQGQE
jgi:hypothetical protein